MLVMLGLALLAPDLAGSAALRHSADFTSEAIVVSADPAPPPDPPTVDSTNPYLPADRDLDECISALPRPDCGSEARGGWRQVLILVAILSGLAFVAWRILRGARRARRKVTHDA